MADKKDLFFEVMTPLGFRVRVTHAYWELIVTIKHPVMAGRESKSDLNVYLFYKAEREKRWICAVSRQTSEEGFLITAYPTDAIKEGVSVWHK